MFAYEQEQGVSGLTALVEINKQILQLSKKTSKERSSMHVISFTTLAFLPGTFVATSSSAGVLELYG